MTIPVNKKTVVHSAEKTQTHILGPKCCFCHKGVAIPGLENVEMSVVCSDCTQIYQLTLSGRYYKCNNLECGEFYTSNDEIDDVCEALQIPSPEPSIRGYIILGQYCRKCLPTNMSRNPGYIRIDLKYYLTG